MEEETDTLDLVMEVSQTEEAFESAINSAFSTGNASKIAVYFGENIDLTLLGKENLYSRSQAEQVLHHFFADHPPKAFNIVHKGNAKTSQYFIGQFTSKNGKSFRVTLNSKTAGGKRIITALTGEAD